MPVPCPSQCAGLCPTWYTLVSLSVVLFCALAAVFTLGEIELNPISRNPLGMAHTK